jgi:cellobiose transport system substrate-binding protein
MAGDHKSALIAHGQDRATPTVAQDEGVNMGSSLKRGAAAMAGLALLVTGCSSGGSPATSPAAGGNGEKVTLTVATFNEFG